MAAGCDDCLREQMGWLAESDYPLEVALQEPEYVYCIDGVPSLTPHKGMVGPVGGVTIWGSTEIPAAATRAELAPSVANTILWVNETAYDVSVLVMTSGPMSFIRGAMGGVLSFVYGYQYAISSPASSGVREETVLGLAGASTTNPQAIQMIGQETFNVDAGGSIQIVPKLYATTTGTGVNRYMAGARMDVTMIGGAA